MSWSNKLQAATTAEAVVNVLNDYLAERDPVFWARVPASVHVESVDGPRDVHRLHHDFVQALKRSRPASVQLQELSVLFLRAAVRLHQIDLREDSGGPPSNDEMGCAPAQPRRIGRY